MKKLINLKKVTFFHPFLLKTDEKVSRLKLVRNTSLCGNFSEKLTMKRATQGGDEDQISKASQSIFSIEILLYISSKLINECPTVPFPKVTRDIYVLCHLHEETLQNVRSLNRFFSINKELLKIKNTSGCYGKLLYRACEVTYTRCEYTANLFRSTGTVKDEIDDTRCIVNYVKSDVFGYKCFNYVGPVDWPAIIELEKKIKNDESIWNNFSKQLHICNQDKNLLQDK